MTLNITSLSQKYSGDRQSSLNSGDAVYLYGDRTYKGKLIHPVEGTYPCRWTVQLDRGGYEAVNVKQISVIESRNNKHFIKPENNYYESDLELPFSEAREESQTSRSKLEREIAQLKKENARLLQQQKELEQDNQLLKKDLDQAKQIIRRAKDISPVMRLSLKRVLRLAHNACMDVQRTVGGWILRMGDKARRFRRLADIWDLISADEFVLSEIFPEDKLVAVELIVPPKRRTRPEPIEKKTFPLMRPEDIIRNRTILLAQSG
ncbi:MAG: hypothetical protein AAGE84_26370 [Cyanobacteria bacterium P01_G01_bin.39]